MIIDWQHHYCPPELVVRRGKEIPPAGTAVYNNKGQVVNHIEPALYDLDAHLRFMDAAGIDRAILSMAGGLSFEETTVVNDAFARVMKAHGDRFTCLGTCLPSRGEATVREVERAIGCLGLKGISIDYETDGHGLDSDALLPFYERVAVLGVPLYIHIAGTREGFDGLLSTRYNLWTSLGTMVVDQSATVRLILSGILSRFPNLKIVIAHMGGGIAALRERFSLYLRRWGEKIWTEMGTKPTFDPPYDVNFDRYFGKIHFDMAGYEGGMNAVRCALLSISPDKLLLGTDYPFNFTHTPEKVREYVERIRGLGLSEEDTKAMLGKNAARLLGI